MASIILLAFYFEPVKTVFASSEVDKFKIEEEFMKAHLAIIMDEKNPRKASEAILIHWEDANYVEELRQEGALILEVDDHPLSILSDIKKMLDMAAKKGVRDDCAWVLTHGIPLLVLQALEKSGRLKL